MGSFVSKCCINAEKKYKKEEVIPTQPEQGETDVKIVANSRATVAKSQETDNHSHNKHDKMDTNDEKKDEKAVSNDKKYGGNREKKTTDRRNRRRKYRDSTDSSSSSSSDSSDSDSDDEHTKSSRQVYKNRSGGTTFISKKTIIGGNKVSIGKNCKNLTIKYGSSNSSPKRKRTGQSEPEQVFKSYYSESGAKEEEQRQYTSLWENNTAPPLGNFIDTRDINVHEFVFESSVRVNAAQWVCMICFPGGCGTGFRVGTTKIMTANHIVKRILDGGYEHVSGLAQNPLAQLQGEGVYAVFNHTTDGPISNRQKFFFKGIIHFHDDKTDTAVLELKDNQIGTPMPLSFTYFSIPKMNNLFSFIGHSEGKRMKINHVDRIIDKANTDTQASIDQVRQWSQQHASREYEFPPNSMLTNPHRYLFHCKFSKGASGSPGVVVLPDGRVVVVTMLLCGYPNWYYDPSVTDELKNTWPKEYCVEQGVNLKSVYESMARNDPNLCREIFSDHTDTIPNPAI